MSSQVLVRGQAVLINGVARLLTRQRTVARIQAAHNEFSRARRFFPPRKDLDRFDPLLARNIAWDGAVYVGFAVGEDRRVQDSRVLAVVPASRFGDAALEAINEWRAETRPSGDPACRRNLVNLVSFAID